MQRYIKNQLVNTLWSEPDSKRDLIGVFSIDADGCLCSANIQTAEELIAKHHLLIEQIVNLIIKKQYAIVYFLVGSNRQDWNTDITNRERHNTMSIFMALPIVCEEVNERLERKGARGICFVNKLTITDLNNHQPPGTHFAAIEERLKGVANEDDTAQCEKRWLFDKLKITLVYPQLHYIAGQHGTAKIEFHFIDDNPNTHIYNAILNFFKAGEKVPHNTFLTLFEYDGTTIKKVDPPTLWKKERITHLDDYPKLTIKGNATIDTNILSTLFELYNSLDHIDKKDLLLFSSTSTITDSTTPETNTAQIIVEKPAAKRKDQQFIIVSKITKNATEHYYFHQNKLEHIPENDFKKLFPLEKKTSKQLACEPFTIAAELPNEQLAERIAEQLQLELRYSTCAPLTATDLATEKLAEKTLAEQTPLETHVDVHYYARKDIKDIDIVVSIQMDKDINYYFYLHSNKSMVKLSKDLADYIFSHGKLITHQSFQTPLEKTTLEYPDTLNTLASNVDKITRELLQNLDQRSTNTRPKALSQSSFLARSPQRDLENNPSGDIKRNSSIQQP